MRLYSGKIPIIASEMVHELIKNEALEVEKEKVGEVQLDIESVLKEYVRTEREINDSVRDTLEARGLDYSSFGRIKRKIAKKQNFGFGEEAIDWIINQLIEVLLHTVHVEEIWVEDRHLRRHMTPILRKHTEIGDDLDREVRKHIKNLSEESSDWDVRYNQVLDKIKRKKGLT